MNSTNNIDERMLKYLPWLGAMAIFMQALDGTILNTSLPTIALELGKSPLEIQSIIVAYTLTVALLIPLSGWLSDKYGTKKVFQSAILIFTLGSVFCAFTTTLPVLVIFTRFAVPLWVLSFGISILLISCERQRLGCVPPLLACARTRLLLRVVFRFC